ncbi:MAG: hypothetical protein ACKVRN_02730 [Pyrinomonadaceae bacterium]
MNSFVSKLNISIFFLVVIISSEGIAQSNPIAADKSSDCPRISLGVFRQMTGSTGELVPEYFDNTLMIDNDSYLSEDRWPLFPLDEVDPAYQFYLTLGPSEIGKKRCGETMEIVGKLITPTGKIFKFRQATYHIFERKLKIITLQRDGISFEVEMQFFAKPLFVKRIFQDGTLKIKATGKFLGTISIESPFSSWMIE